MNCIWKLVVEISVEPGDMPSGATKGFVNVTTWADSADAAQHKLAKYIERFNWQIISIEEATPISEDRHYSEPLDDMVARTRANRNAIILGTFHGYKED